MIGLLMKDILNLRKQGKVLGLLFVFYLVMALSSDNPYMFLSIVSLLMVMLTMTSMAYDERSHWERYALTMPVSRKTLVLSKYLLGFLLMLAAGLLNILFLLIVSKETIAESVVYTLGVMGIALFFMSLILPILFRYGVEKGRLLMMAVLFTPTLLVVLGARMGLIIPEVPQVKPIMVGMFLALLVLLVALSSILLSVKIFENKAL